MTTTIDTLPHYDWRNLGTGETLAAQLGEQRSRHWAAQSSRGLEVFSYLHAAQVLRSREFAIDLAEVAHGSGITADDGWLAAHHDQMLLGMSGPGHAKIRAALAPYFAPAAVERWRPDVREIVNGLLDKVDLSQPFDLARDVLHKLPALMFCRLINAPDEDAPFIGEMSDSLLLIFQQNPDNRDVILAAGQQLEAYVRDFVAKRRRLPGNDLVSRLIRHESEGLLTPEQLFHNVAMFVSASTDNTSNQLGITLMHLLEDAGRWDAVVKDPSLVRGACQESVRLVPRVGTIDRVTVTDTVVDGLRIPAETRVYVSVLAAHRDPAGLRDPDSYDLSRTERRQPLTFGGGGHFCIGFGLAEVEIDEAIRTLTDRTPHLRLYSEPEWFMTDRVAAVPGLRVIA